MTKRFLSACLALALLALCAGGAAEDLSGCTVSCGVVTAAAWTDLTAPYSGTLLPFDAQAGDTVRSGDVLFRMRTVTLRAPEDGTVSALFARAGDDAAAVCARYGGILALSPANPYLIRATTAGAAGRNRDLVPGMTVFFRSDRTGRPEGTARIFTVSGDVFAAEILTGSFDLKETLNLYLDDGYTAKCGVGSVARRDPVSVAAAGRISAVLVSEGDAVTAGQPLATVLGTDADPGAVPEISAGADGVIALVGVQPGQQVWKGALLARIWHTDRLEITAEVDETDLPRIHVGDTCPVVLDMDPDTVLHATVTEIGGLGVTRQNAAYYTVRLSLEETGLPLGASASVYIPKN